MTDTDLRRQLHETRAALLEEMTATAKLRAEWKEAMRIAREFRDLPQRAEERYDELRVVARGLADVNRELVEIIKGAKTS